LKGSVGLEDAVVLQVHRASIILCKPENLDCSLQFLQVALIKPLNKLQDNAYDLA